ncbi:hypothetical protein [Nitratireductor soli]|uniref:hypothetical protein n=1 Tax=Nitratireductor soli TaxID=1670619 RepID=UPI00065E95B1|nr:hypothetical protein [Nitratireductor soli]
MRLLELLFLAGTFAAGSAQASSILVVGSPSPQRGASTAILEANPTVDAGMSARAVPLSYPTPSFDATVSAEPFRLTRSMVAVGTALPDAPVATDETTAAVATKPKRRFNLPPILIRAGVKTEPVMYAIAPPRAPAPKPAETKPGLEDETAEEEDEEVTLPATKPGSPL